VRIEAVAAGREFRQDDQTCAGCQGLLDGVAHEASVMFGLPDLRRDLLAGDPQLRRWNGRRHHLFSFDRLNSLAARAGEELKGAHDTGGADRRGGVVESLPGGGFVLLIGGFALGMPVEPAEADGVADEDI
jgi:hypothetical protein